MSPAPRSSISASRDRRGPATAHHHRQRLCRQVQLRVAGAARPFRRRRHGEIGHLQLSALVLAQCLSGPADRHGRQRVRGDREAPRGARSRRRRPRYRPLLERMLQPDPKDRPESMAAVAAWRPDSASADATLYASRGATAGAPRAPLTTTRRTQPRRKSAFGERLEIAALVLVALLSLFRRCLLSHDGAGGAWGAGDRSGETGDC